jgi:rRNA maturation endonuclease Nob1
MAKKRVIVDKETNKVVGLEFKRCGGCGRVFSQEHEGNCSDCGKELTGIGIINELRDDNHIFIGK